MSRTTSCPLAGFQVITYGRFWVITEGFEGTMGDQIAIAHPGWGEHLQLKMHPASWSMTCIT